MKQFLGSGLDGRTVGPGTLAGTVSMTVVMFAFFGFGGVFDVVGMIALSFLFASVPAGIVVGILGRFLYWIYSNRSGRITRGC